MLHNKINSALSGFAVIPLALALAASPLRAEENSKPSASASENKPVKVKVAYAEASYLPLTEKLPIAPGPFEPSWESLSKYQTPEWFRDAKFGIWAHWGPQCQPEYGDWYARHIYVEEYGQAKYHRSHYGHPSKVGFKDVINLWKVDKFDPGKLVALYKKVGAKYFVAMANHHDNFDLWNSKYQPWNSVNMGPKKDLIGQWAAAAKKEGLPFGVSIHASAAWTWYEVSQLSDASGPLAGVPYDGKLTKADGKGAWWEGYDPQDLYAQNHRPSPFPKDLNKSRQQPGDPASHEYSRKYFNRVLDLVESYQPDLVYFDDAVLPAAFLCDPAYGLGITANIYNMSIARNGGRNEAVVNTKALTVEQEKCIVRDYEMATPDEIRPLPWQVDACIGGWHYAKGQIYLPADKVIRNLVDVVSKNGNMLLNIPLRGDGSLDEPATAVVEAIGAWMAVNGEAIYGTRPWRTFGEGATMKPVGPGSRKGGTNKFRINWNCTPADMRFTTKGDTLYAVVLAWPENGKVLIKSLAKNNIGNIKKVTLLGNPEPLAFSRTAEGLEVTFPATKPCDIAYSLKIEGGAK